MSSQRSDTTHQDGLVASAPVPARAFSAWTEIAGSDLNFTPVPFAQAEADPAWTVDRRCVELAHERAGDPVPDGSFAVARRALADFAYADPSIIRVVHDRDGPREGRDLLLVGRFYGLRLLMGVRVGGVVDGLDDVDGRRVHRFSWHYRTLDGHLERGQMDYDLRKDVEDGRVTFAIRVYSQRADDVHPVLQVGNALFGRWMQVRFYDRTVARLEALVRGRTHAVR